MAWVCGSIAAGGTMSTPSLPFQSLKISPEIENDPQLRAKVSGADEQLAEIIGSSSARTDVEWEYRPDGGVPVIILHLKDWTGAVERLFAPPDFDRPAYMRSRLYRTWGDLLQVRSHKELSDLTSGHE